MTVKVYTVESCPWCKRAKEYLTEKGVAFQAVDLGKDEAEARRIVAETHQQGVPVIEVNGEYIIGFDKPALDKALGL